MSIETFVAAFHKGYWRIGFDDQWFGTYRDRTTAERSCVRIASDAAGDLPTLVVVRESDGIEALLWELSNEMPAGAQISR